MKLTSPLPHRKGRIEIIPLIDIMFFLLAAFMMVSINKIRVKSLKVNLPTDVPTAQLEKKEDFMTISLTEDGQMAIDKAPVANKDEMRARLGAIYAANHDQKFMIAADNEGRYGDVINLLGLIRSVGFQKVSFNIKSAVLNVPPGTYNTPGSEPLTNAPGDASAPAPATASAPAATPAPAAPATPPAAPEPAPATH